MGCVMRQHGWGVRSIPKPLITETNEMLKLFVNTIIIQSTRAIDNFVWNCGDFDFDFIKVECYKVKVEYTVYGTQPCFPQVKPTFDLH